MLAYTITKGGTYSTNAYEYNYTTSIICTITNEIVTGVHSEDDCNNWPKTTSRTYYTASTERLFHDGRKSSSIFISYKDNDLSSYKAAGGTDGDCIGGYYNITSFTLQGSTVIMPNGKKTAYEESLGYDTEQGFAGLTNARTFPLISNYVWDQPWFGTTNVPEITTKAVVRNRYNTTITKASFKSSFIKAGDSISLVTFEKDQKTSTTPLGGQTTVETVIINKEQKTLLGYSYAGGEGSVYPENNSLDFNYADTVVFITNNDILWYITDFKEGNFSEKFKSTRGIGQQITIKYVKPTKKVELPIGLSVYGQTPPEVKSTPFSDTTALSVISFKEQNITFNDNPFSFPISFPIGTYVEEENILTNSSTKFIIKKYTKYDNTVPTELTTNSKTILQLINANSLQFHRTYTEKAKELSVIKTFITSSFGQYTSSDENDCRTTIKDKIGYTSLVPNRYSLNADGGGELIFNKGYLGGQAAINNLSIVEQVSFKDGQTYKNINGGYSSLYPNVPLAFATFAKSFTFDSDNNTKTATAYSPIEDTNLKLDLRYVLISYSKESISNNGQKYTKIETTKHEFGLKGAKPNAYLNYGVNNSSKGLLVNPNEYCRLNSALFNDMNCGIFGDDGNIESFITRILYPGTYLAINTDGSRTLVIKEVVTTNQNNKFYYYLPWNGSIESVDSINLLSPSVTFASHNISNFLPELSSMTKI